MARPKGRLDKKPRAARGSKMKFPPLLKVTVGNDFERVAAQIGTEFNELDDEIKVEFGKLVNHWTQTYFLDAIRGSIKNSMFIRSGRLLKGVKTKMELDSMGSEDEVSFRSSAVLPEDISEQGMTQEFGRKPNLAGAGGGKGQTYMVPLASWIAQSGKAGQDRGGVTTEDIIKDLSQPGVFFPKKVFRTKAGPARIFFVYKDKKERLSRKGKTLKPTKVTDTLGRKVTRGKLKEEVTAMYLAYKGYTGVYGSHKMRDERKHPRMPKTPIAAQMGLTNSPTHPAWFSRAAANSLERLYRAIQGASIEYSDALQYRDWSQDVATDIVDQVRKGLARGRDDE